MENESQNLSIVHLTDKQNKLIEILYFNPNIMYNDLVMKLCSNKESVTKSIVYINKINPPLIMQKVENNIRYFALTDEGKNYYEQSIGKIKKNKFYKKTLVNNFLISYILSNALEQNNTPNATFLVELGVEEIVNNFTFNEFIFLAIKTGIISKQEISGIYFEDINTKLLTNSEQLQCLKKFYQLIELKNNLDNHKIV